MRPPVIFRESEIQIGERGADRDVADREGRTRELAGFLLERRKHCVPLHLERSNQKVRRVAACALVTQQQKKLDKAATKRLPAQRRHAVLKFTRNELGTVVE